MEGYCGNTAVCLADGSNFYIRGLVGGGKAFPRRIARLTPSRTACALNPRALRDAARGVGEKNIVATPIARTPSPTQ